MYAVKKTNLIISPVAEYFIKAHDFADACEILRRVRAGMNDSWEEGTDYTAEVVEVDDDFDFENQPDWN
jgi:hypothetical protein